MWQISSQSPGDGLPYTFRDWDHYTAYLMADLPSSPPTSRKKST
jgi:gamma-glutamyl:cysteine ligase YbdK (ATP-grasp superfamily)